MLLLPANAVAAALSGRKASMVPAPNSSARPRRPSIARRLSTVHRKLKKRDFRQLWIARVNAAARAEGISYSKFIAGLIKAGVTLNRKSLSEIAIQDPAGFKTLVDIAKKA